MRANFAKKNIGPARGGDGSGHVAAWRVAVVAVVYASRCVCVCVCVCAFVIMHSTHVSADIAEIGVTRTHDLLLTYYGLVSVVIEVVLVPS